MSLSSHAHTEREDENQAIDRMFAFVKHEHMETPRSSIITRHRSMSTPRRPLATSTPLFHGAIAPTHLHLSANSAIHPKQSRLNKININNNSIVSPTLSMSTNAEKMDETIATAISQQQIFQSKYRAILSEISFQQDQVIQASDVIALCQKKLIFNGTFQEMNAQRTLLVANERRYALHLELDKLKKHYNNKQHITSTSQQDDSLESCDDITPPPPKCAVNITSIKILLNRSFYIKTVDEAICKTDDQLYATQLMNVLDMGTLRVSTVQFRESIRFQNLSTDFSVLLEIYALKIMKRPVSPRYACASKIANKAKAIIESGDSFFPTSDFHRCGVLQLNRSTMGKQQFLLDEVEYPLEGTVEVSVNAFEREPYYSSSN